MSFGLLILSVFLLCLILLSAFCSSSEVALFSLTPMKVKSFKNSKEKRKQWVAELLASPKDLLITIIMLNVVVNILIQNVTASLFGKLSGWAFTVGIPLALTVILGEVIPKSIGMANNVAMAHRAAPILRFTQKIFYPMRKALQGITTYVSRFMFFFLRKEEEISTDELLHALTTSKMHGILNEEEANLVRGYLRLQESQAKELMRPREEVLFFDLSDPLSKLIHLFVDQECSRIPIFQETFDNVVGVMTSQIFFLKRDLITSTQDLFKYCKKPFFVPESIGAPALMRQMYDKEESIALVVDEYGSISGLIALEDLVETVVGEIADARDKSSRYTRSGEDVMIASGKLELAEFQELFGVALRSENQVVTLGGWLSEQLNDIPKTGTKYVAHHFLFHVLAADQKRVRRVYIRRLKKEP